ncbi:MAG: FtsX-like permease family protein [Candidatus Methylomirabilales bacterium]
MTRYFVRSLGIHIRSGRSLYFLTVFGVALGVASVICIQIINRNALAAFTGGIQAVSGDADFSILGRTPTFPERLYPKVLATEGVTAAWPVYRVDVALADREKFFLEVMGLDLFAPVRVPWTGERGDISDALARPGWVAIAPQLAEEMSWTVGDFLEVSSGSRRVRLVVGALVDFQRVSPLASRRLAVMDIAQAQSLLGRPGELHQIDVQVAAGTDAADLIARLQSRLGPTVQVLTPEQREHRAAGLLSAFRLNLTALSLISLFVGVFLVYSSTQALLVRRRSEFGLLRSVGATRGQVFGLILGEVFILGVLGVALGLPLGYWAAEANVDVVSATLSNLYLLQEIESLQMPLWLYVLAAVIGIGGAIAGALAPALDISRKDTKALLAVFTLHERVKSIALPLFMAGVCVLILAGLWFWLIGWEWKPAGFVLGIALLIALPLFTPFIIQRITGWIRVRGFGLGYSLKSLGDRLQTTAFAVSSLAIAVSMLIGITLMIGSFRRTVEVWVNTSVKADIYISTSSWRGRGNEATLDPEITASLAAHPGVVAVDQLRKFFGYAGERRIALVGVDMALPGGEARFPLLEGEPSEVFRQVRDEGAILIGETLARKSGLGVGDRFSVSGPDGDIAFPIAGVYYDYSPGGGLVVMDLRTMDRHFGPGPIHSIALYLEPGRDPETVVDELKARYGGLPLRIRSNRRLREQVMKIFDQTFAVTRLLQAMSLLIAVCGITLTLLILARERISELAVYRAIGAFRRQLFWVFVGKGLGMGLLGLGIGLVGGLALAAILIFVINRAYFGWTIQVYWPWVPVLQQTATILAAAIVASLYPAIRASQAPATELSREDI